ncbi:TraR/DksA C4-type zinc finger protein [Natribacillus halophilus]|uniref:RNA polymerase-binding protein DksA n=1 Tax=Natribacillus halophilus TaxID=549003 RepID=A0A1G8LDJ8_9BACI|nr:TraR/DksA C4-type zinc finger protein [Natribacillus halophilus]SDI53715.1 RNA polymerase-binding protein DksA [Natribacillus halophilus]
MISQDEMHTLKKRLLEMKQDIETQFEHADRPEETGELSQSDNHPGDQATELHEQQKNVALHNQSRQQLADIHHALQAIEDGHYGRCEVCDEPIPYERLELVPETMRCVRHADQEATDTERPAEEDSLDASLQEKNFDRANTWETASEHGTSRSPSDM